STVAARPTSRASPPAPPVAMSSPSTPVAPGRCPPLPPTYTAPPLRRSRMSHRSDQPGETTCRCGRPTRDDRSLCDACLEQLGIALGDCAWLDAEIEVTMTRQRAAATSGGAPSATTPLPWHERAAESRRNLHALLVSWVRFC